MASSILALLFVACGGDPGTPIPDLEPVTTAEPTVPTPPAPDDTPPGAMRTITVSVEGTGNVRSEPAGIDCPGSCSAAFAPSTQVTLVSTPAEGWRLDAWGGACSGAGTCSLVVAADVSVTSSLALVDARWDPSVGAPDCAAAWGTAGEKLSACDTTKDDYVVVRKAKRNVALCKKGKLVKNLRSGLGFAPTGDKEKEGDGKTPEGVFYVPRLVPNSTFHKAFLLSYPMPEDAKRGVNAKLITTQQRAQIESAHASCTEPPQYTALGGVLEIHGNGSDDDWTAGCVAVDDSGMDLLWSSIGVGDTIVVMP